MMQAVIGRRIQLGLSLAQQFFRFRRMAVESLMTIATLHFHTVDRVIDHALLRLKASETSHLLRHGIDSGECDARENKTSDDTIHFEFLNNIEDEIKPDATDVPVRFVATFVARRALP